MKLEFSVVTYGAYSKLRPILVAFPHLRHSKEAMFVWQNKDCDVIRPSSPTLPIRECLEFNGEKNC